GSAELPSMPWQAAQTAALLAPAVASPQVAGVLSASRVVTGAGSASGAADTVAASWAMTGATARAAATPRMRENFMGCSGTLVNSVGNRAVRHAHARRGLSLHPPGRVN